MAIEPVAPIGTENTNGIRGIRGIRTDAPKQIEKNKREKLNEYSNLKEKLKANPNTLINLIKEKKKNQKKKNQKKKKLYKKI